MSQYMWPHPHSRTTIKSTKQSCVENVRDTNPSIAASKPNHTTTPSAVSSCRTNYTNTNTRTRSNAYLITCRWKYVRGKSPLNAAPTTSIAGRGGGRGGVALLVLVCVDRRRCSGKFNNNGQQRISLSATKDRERRLIENACVRLTRGASACARCGFGCL